MKQVTANEVSLSVRVPRETADDLRAIARREDRKVAGVIRIAIREYIDRQTADAAEAAA